MRSRLQFHRASAKVAVRWIHMIGIHCDYYCWSQWSLGWLTRDQQLLAYVAKRAIKWIPTRCILDEYSKGFFLHHIYGSCKCSRVASRHFISLPGRGTCRKTQMWLLTNRTIDSRYTASRLVTTDMTQAVHKVSIVTTSRLRPSKRQ